MYIPLWCSNHTKTLQLAALNLYGEDGDVIQFTVT